MWNKYYSLKPRGYFKRRRGVQDTCRARTYSKEARKSSPIYLSYLSIREPRKIENLHPSRGTAMLEEKTSNDSASPHDDEDCSEKVFKVNMIFSFSMSQLLVFLRFCARIFQLLDMEISGMIISRFGVYKSSTGHTHENDYTKPVLFIFLCFY